MLVVALQLAIPLGRRVVVVAMRRRRLRRDRRPVRMGEVMRRGRVLGLEIRSVLHLFLLLLR
jgi:hypothetical protein